MRRRLAFLCLPCLFIASVWSEANAKAQSQGDGAAAVPPNTAFVPPPRNACHSLVDQFYEAEPGVYGYWPLCEPGNNPALYDYVGGDSWVRGHGAWGQGETNVSATGPLGDEPGNEANNGSTFVEAQGLPLNSRGGTLAAWLNFSGNWDSPARAIFIGAVHGKSMLSLGASIRGKRTCFDAVLADTEGSRSVLTAPCDATAGAWHRVVLTWSSRGHALYVDGAQVSADTKPLPLDDTEFYYKLYPGFGKPGQILRMAKLLISNRDWSAQQIVSDHAPKPIQPPSGGIQVTHTALGEIHEDVLGYQDNNAKLDQPGVASAMREGLGAAGMRAVRYADGAMGIGADEQNWRGGPSCTGMGIVAPALKLKSGNSMQTYFSDIVNPLRLDSGYTVNYGSNPPDCNAGGNPEINGADLVRYANDQLKLHIRYWEIGNEEYNGGSSELDLHATRDDGGFYAKRESEFYEAMKAADPSILIGVPVALGLYSWETNWTLPVLRDAHYDAVVFHSYPMRDPITDGSTLYPDRVASNLHSSASALLHLQTMLLNAGKNPSSIWVTEWDGDVNGNRWSKQSLGAVMPLFATMQLADYMDAGVRWAAWLEQGSSDGCFDLNFDPSAPTAYSWVHCGGTFVTYTGPVPNEVNVGFKPGDLSPPARAFQLLSMSGFVRNGEHMLQVVTDQDAAPWLAAYAATHMNSYAVILINRDMNESHEVPVAFDGLTHGYGGTQWTYGRAEYDHARTGDWSVPPLRRTLKPWHGAVMVDLPPWSASVIVLS